MTALPMKVRFGILGTASIARALIGQQLRYCELTGIASRNIAKAHAFADEAGIPKRYEGYDALLSDPDIDAVYIPLPQHLHCEFAVKAADAKKHVIVEKPLALSVNEVETMSSACSRNGVLLMEALMYRFRRVHNRAKELVQNGTIGRIRYVNFAWSHNLGLRSNRGFRMEKKLGGGCLFDLGVYGVDWIRFVTECEPQLMHSIVRRNSDGLDLFSHATLKTDDIVCMMTCGYTSDVNYYYLGGELGSIYSPVSLSGRVLPSVLHIHLMGSDKRYTEDFAPENAYATELDYFGECIKCNRHPFSDGENAMKNIAMLHEISEKSISV